VVDEYEGDALSRRRKRSSSRPASLGQLFEFFLGVWPLLGVLEINFGGKGYDNDRMLAFVDPSSAFYPQFKTLCHQSIVAWGDEMRSLKSASPRRAVAIR
jgi:hypothetical protein